MNARTDVADVVRAFGDDFLATFSATSKQVRVLSDIASCRTAAKGAHKWRCGDCGHEEIAYNSCRNRHCPQCQAAARAEWVERQRDHLLDVEYFHVVFTLPNVLGPIALQNKRLVYGLLFQAVTDTLTTIAADPRHLGVKVGFLAILHTWGQRLDHHPHIHCVVPGGGLAPDHSQWISCPKGFFLPVRVLSRRFRETFMQLLDRAHARDLIALHGRLAHLRDPAAWQAHIDQVRHQEWVVYCKPPFGGAEQVLKYLARYTNRVAISNNRLIAMNGRSVTFTWKDYTRGHRVKAMTLDAFEFLRRFLIHILPTGFHRIRYYGLLSHRNRDHQLSLCRQLIATKLDRHPQAPRPSVTDSPALHPAPRCPQCKNGRLALVGRVIPCHSLQRRNRLYNTS